jgi:hypothetical protein
MVNPEKLVTWDTQDTERRQKDKKTKTRTQYVLDTNIGKHTQIK